MIKEKEEKVLKMQYFENKKRNWKRQTEVTQEEIKNLTKTFEEEIKKIQFNFIEILAIFVAIIGFLFGFVNFSSRWQFSFCETFGLILLFGGFMIIFILITHKLFSKS